MKTALLIVLLASVTLVGGGCAFMDPEDRDFYGKGWVKPTELDREPVHHKILDPSHPETTTTTSTTAARTAPTATPEPEWIVPIPSAQ